MPSLNARMREIGLRLERAVKQHRWLLRYRHCTQILQHWIDQTPKEQPSAKARCLLDLRRIAVDGEQGRRFHSLVTLLCRGGYEVSMIPRLQFLQSGHRRYKQWALAKVTPFMADQQADQQADTFVPFDLCLTDSGRDSRLAKRTIQVVTDTRSPLAEDELAMPYGMFPKIWDEAEDARFEEYRQSRRVWRLFFGGHCSQESYTRIRKYNRLSVVDRYQVVGEVNRYFSGSTLDITSDDELESATRQRHESFVMIDNAVFRTQPSDWLGLLSKSDFFLAAPGCDYPLSHNAVEAIAVGAIPVLEYDSLFVPSLCDGVNCIAYRGIDGLRNALARIDSMSHAEIGRLRQGVIDYYESHLSPHAFCNRLGNPGVRRVHLFHYLAPARRRRAA